MLLFKLVKKTVCCMMMIMTVCVAVGFLKISNSRFSPFLMVLISKNGVSLICSVSIVNFMELINFLEYTVELRFVYDS